MDALLEVLANRIKEAKENHELVTKFGELKTDEERLIFALRLLDRHKIELKYETKRKNAADSTKLREQGNKLYCCGWDYKAAQKYTESILYAENRSEELALAYANRSSVLFRMQKFEDSMDDIDTALGLNYPDKLKTKLFERKGLCLTALGRPEAKSYFEKALNWLDKMILDEDRMKKMRNQLEKFITADFAIVEIAKNLRDDDDLPDIEFPSDEVPCASDALAIKYSKELGRHLVATRKIKPGDVLAVEEPFSMILDSENLYTHCSRCLNISWAMIPCEHCVTAMYCSPLCRSGAWHEYHEVECKVLGFLKHLDSHMQCLFSMRLAIVATRRSRNLNDLRKIIEKVEQCKDPRTKGFSEDGMFQSYTYSSIYSLVTNVEKRSVQDLFGRAFYAACITYILSRESNLFGKKLSLDANKLSENKDVTFIGGLILKHQQIIPSNIHSFSEFRGDKPHELGAAAMPFYSLINHSCDPNVTRQSRQEHIVLYALYPIEKGEQIFDNYGQLSAVTPREERQKNLLKQFYFKCECTPCVEDWPLYDKIPSYQAQQLSGHVKHRLAKILQRHSRYIDLATERKIESDPNMLNNLLRMIELLFELADRPCKELNAVVETLKQVYFLQGNRFDVPDQPYAIKS